MTSPKPPGRPRIPDASKVVKLTISLPPALEAAWRAAARAAGVSVSAWVRGRVARP